MPFNTFREAYDAYLAALEVLNPGSLSSKPGPARDAALLPLSCISALAYDNHGYSYPIWVGPGQYQNGRTVVHCVGAPSGWYESDLIDSCHRGVEHIAFDHGQGWYWMNFSELMLEIAALEAK